MNSLLVPDRLEVDPWAANATVKFKHWLICLEVYLRSSTIDLTDHLKMYILNTLVSPQVFLLIEDAASYAEAIMLLKEQYVKPVNEVYARHLLATRRQRPGESIDEFLCALQVLGRNCNCQAVSAAQHTELLIRDAFVAGMKSNCIRQRLLERGTLCPPETMQLSNLLQVAFQNINADTSDHAAHSWVPPSNSSAAQGCAVQQPADARSPKCYFCSQVKHPRQSCPARNATCNGCGRKGHFAKACQA